jgi:hypothetical protein
MKGVTHTNFPNISFNLSPIKVAENVIATWRLSTPFGNIIIVEFYLIFRWFIPTNVNCLNSLKISMKWLGWTQVHPSCKNIGYQSRVAWFLKIFFKNSLVSTYPQEPTSSRECCLSACNNRFNPKFVDVIEHPIHVIKIKKNCDKIRWN